MFYLKKSREEINGLQFFRAKKDLLNQHTPFSTIQSLTACLLQNNNLFGHLTNWIQ